MKSFLILAFALWLISSRVTLSASHNIAFPDRAYRLAHKLLACGLLDDAVVAQLPWSEVEFHRLIRQAEAALSKQESSSCGSFAESILVELKKLLPEDRPKLRPLAKAELTWLSHDSVGRGAILNPPGNVDATLNPLLDNRGGREFGRQNLALETTHSWDIGDNFSILVTPRSFIDEPFRLAPKFTASLQQGYGKIVFGNMEWQIGRDEMIFGYGKNGGTLFSINPRPMDHLRLRSPSPFLLPGFLKGLGPSQATLFVSDLGADREYPHAFLYGILFNIRPHSRLELGFGHAITLGGKGAPSWEWVDIPLEFFFLRRGGLVGEQAGVGASPADHRSVFSFLYRPPISLSPEIYGEMFWDDTGFSQLMNHFKYRTGWQLGIYFPILSGDGRDEFRFEYLSLPSYAYHHTYYSSGYVLNHRIIGASTGPASKELSLTYQRQWSFQQRTEMRVSYQHYDGNLYAYDGMTFAQTLLQSRLSEERYRLGLTHFWKWNEDWMLGTELDLEKIIHFNFLKEGRTQTLFSVFLKYGK